MTRTKTSIMTKTLPTEIYINGKKIHGGMLRIKYIPTNEIQDKRGGIIPNQPFIHGTPLVGYDPNIPSDLYGKNGINGIGVKGKAVAFGTGIFDWIPVIGPILGKVTGLGINETSGGFPWLSVIPAVMGGIDLIKGLFQGKGFTKEAKICDHPGQPCDIMFKSGNGIFKTKANLNGMHRALLADQQFLNQLHKSSGISFPTMDFGRGGDLSSEEHGNLIYPDNLEKYNQTGQEMNALVGLGDGSRNIQGGSFCGMKNINKV